MKKIIGLILFSAILFSGCMHKNIHTAAKSFDSLPNIYGFENPAETAKSALNERYGADWHKQYQISGYYNYPSIPFKHWFVKISPDFSVLITAEEIYFLSPPDFNEFLALYGENISLEESDEMVSLFGIYLKLYGMSSPAQSEELFTKKHLGLFTDDIKTKFNVEPEDFTRLTAKKENSHYLLGCYTITRVSSSVRMPSAQDIIISRYLVKFGNRGEIEPNLLGRTKYEQAIPSGPR